MSFERFTDRARRATVLAQEEARLLKHNYMGTEHLLLGLLAEGEGVAAQALDSLGITLVAVRAKVEEAVGSGTSSTGHLPFTPRAKKVLELSLREAMNLGHNYISTEHLLLGMIFEGNGLGTRIIQDLGVPLEALRKTTMGLLASYDTPVEDHPESGELLTAIELDALAQTGALWNTLCRVVSTGPTRDADLGELAFHIHGIQRAIGSQAAARLDPTNFRALGKTLRDQSAGQGT